MRTRHAALGLFVSCAACGISVVGIGPTDDGGISATNDGSAGSPEGGSSSGDEGGPNPGTDSGPIPGDFDAGPVSIASAGSVVAPTGNAQQTHLIYAENGKRWWLFTITSDAPSSLQAYSSTDFHTWTAAGELALPKAHNGQGSNFSVAYASIASHDIVHLGIGLAGTAPARTHYHARAAINGATIAWSPVANVVTVNDDLLGDPEGSVTLITASGRVTDFTGWAPYQGSGAQTGNQDAYSSVATDDGLAAWTSAFGDRTDISAASKTINARTALSLGGESVIAIWELGDSEPDPSNLRSARNPSGSWLSAISVFASDTKFGVNDWGATALTPTDVHAIRFTNAFEHRRWNVSWSDGDAIPTLAGVKKNSGLVVLHDATHVYLAAIAGDASVQMTSWSAGAWSTWKVVAPASAGRSSLSGFWSPTAGFGFVWTEAAHVAGVRVP